MKGICCCCYGRWRVVHGTSSGHGGAGRIAGGSRKCGGEMGREGRRAQIEWCLFLPPFFVRGLILWKNLQMAVRSDDGSGIRWIFLQ